METKDLTERSARDVLEDHLELRMEGDLERDIERNYREDVVLLTPSGSFHGHDGVRDSAELLYQAIKKSENYEYESVTVDDRMAMLEWRADGENMDISGGVDSYLIEDGKICAQTIRYTVVYRDLSQTSLA